MTGNAIILEPTAAGGIAPRGAWRPLDRLAGKVVGFIDNSKPNFQHLVDDLAELLVTRHGVASIVRHRKLGASIPAPEAALADLQEKCDFVITGSGD
jgi:hypothetical protein